MKFGSERTNCEFVAHLGKKNSFQNFPYLTYHKKNVLILFRFAFMFSFHSYEQTHFIIVLNNIINTLNLGSERTF